MRTQRTFDIAARPLLGSGRVQHARLRPAAHRFGYRSYVVLLPLRSLRAAPAPLLRRNRFGLISFHDRDHGDGRTDCLDWLDELLAREGIDDAEGEVWLQCFPRVLGYAFKPVSFWYCERRDGSLAAIVAEVNNTFGDRHCYVLAGPGLGWGRELIAPKQLHVSPFCRVEGRYRFRFMRSAPRADDCGRIVARVEHDDSDGPLLITSQSGTLQTLRRATLLRAFFGTPLMTLALIVRIHWQALRLLGKRVPLVERPAAPPLFVSCHLHRT
jgi:DUF1365 family protein